MLKRDELADPNSCLNRARDDEWVFVLLERDPAMPAALRAWIDERVRLGKNRPGDAQLADVEAKIAELRAKQESAELPPLNMTTHDGRTPAELVADGDHRRPDGRIYLPPHLAGRERRRFLRELLLLEREPGPDVGLRRVSFAHAGGDVVCEQCGEKYYEHPLDCAEPCLHVLCDRSRVKL